MIWVMLMVFSDTMEKGVSAWKWKSNAWKDVNG